MNHKFTLKDASAFGWEGLSGRAYNSREDFERASTAYFEVNGSHGRVKNTLSDRIYYVIDGKGEFVIEDRKIPVEKTDVVIIPRDTFYDYRGKLRLFLVHSPAFNVDNDVRGE